MQTSDGTTVDLSNAGIIAVVGPNNAGKSKALQDMHAHLYHGGSPNGVQVVKTLTVEREGSSSDLLAWMASHAHEMPGNPGIMRRAGSQQIQKQTAIQFWSHTEGLQQLTQWMVYLATAESRLGLVGSTSSYDRINEVPETPLQVLFERPELERALSDACMQAFGEGLVLNRFSGSMLHLHVGTLPPPRHAVPSRSYLERLSKLPRIEDQGHGMKSFVGLMLAIVALDHPLILIDEPEAFLHPPQARLFATKLAGLAPTGKQVMIATHSADVLLGLLDARGSEVAIVRLQRRGEMNLTASLPETQLRELWATPILRFSNVLDGIFHRGVIVCEGDSDCSYYRAVLEAGLSEDSLVQDYLFVPAGGKQRIYLLARALRALDIPVRVIADLDLLRSTEDVVRLVEALGGNWSDNDARSLRVIQADTEHVQSPLMSFVRQELELVLDKVGGSARITPQIASEIRRITRAEDGWTVVKETGISGFRQGDATAEARALLERLKTDGLYLVTAGVLERWHPEVPGHGPEWVGGVFDASLHRESPALSFLGDLIQTFK